jgi:hypothetical protein
MYLYLKYLIYFISGSILITSITIIAEKKSPKIAGIMMSLPVITFLSLLFMAISQGADFSSKAAVWNPIGAIADLVYMGLFTVGTGLPGYIQKNTGRRESKYGKNEKIIEILAGLLFGFTGYFFFILVSSKFQIASGWISLAYLWISAIVFYVLFKRLKEIKLEKPQLVSAKEILFRGLFGGGVVAAVVILGDSAGHMWGGLFSSFPGTITPVLVLLHLKNGKDMSCCVIKSAPIGLSGTGLYSCMVWLLYPVYGIIMGTLVSYLAVFVFLFVLFFGLKGRIEEI